MALPVESLSRGSDYPEGVAGVKRQAYRVLRPSNREQTPEFRSRVGSEVLRTK